MSRSVSAPSSVTNTSPCWNGLIVPGSTFRYGSNFCAWTVRPRALSSRPRDAATMPLPSPGTTPPVTKTYFVEPVVIVSPRAANVPREGACHTHVSESYGSVPTERASEVGSRLAERVQPRERGAREGAAEPDQPRAGDDEGRDRAVGLGLLQPELDLEVLARELEREPPRGLDGEHEQRPARVGPAEEARAVRAVHAPARAGGEAPAVGLDRRQVRPPVRQGVRVGGQP